MKQKALEEEKQEQKRGELNLQERRASEALKVPKLTHGVGVHVDVPPQVLQVRTRLNVTCFAYW